MNTVTFRGIIETSKQNMEVASDSRKIFHDWELTKLKRMENEDSNIEPPSILPFASRYHDASWVLKFSSYFDVNDRL